MFDYIKDHWFGHQTLAISFWLNFVVQNIVVNSLTKSWDPPFLILIVLLAGYIWGLVGTFRASARYEWTNIWRILTTLFLIFSIVLNLTWIYFGIFIQIFGPSMGNNSSF